MKQKIEKIEINTDKFTGIEMILAMKINELVSHNSLAGEECECVKLCGNIKGVCTHSCHDQIGTFESPKKQDTREERDDWNPCLHKEGGFTCNSTCLRPKQDPIDVEAFLEGYAWNHKQSERDGADYRYVARMKEIVEIIKSAIK